MAMDSFKEEIKKKRLGKYYYLILKIPIIPPGSHIYTQVDDEESKECKDEVNDPRNV